MVNSHRSCLLCWIRAHRQQRGSCSHSSGCAGAVTGNLLAPSFPEKMAHLSLERASLLAWVLPFLWCAQQESGSACAVCGSLPASPDPSLCSFFLTSALPTTYRRNWTCFHLTKGKMLSSFSQLTRSPCLWVTLGCSYNCWPESCWLSWIGGCAACTLAE